MVEEQKFTGVDDNDNGGSSGNGGKEAYDCFVNECKAAAQEIRRQHEIDTAVTSIIPRDATALTYDDPSSDYSVEKSAGEIIQTTDDKTISSMANAKERAVLFLLRNFSSDNLLTKYKRKRFSNHAFVEKYNQGNMDELEKRIRLSEDKFNEFSESVSENQSRLNDEIFNKHKYEVTLAGNIAKLESLAGKLTEHQNYAARLKKTYSDDDKELVISTAEQKIDQIEHEMEELNLTQNDFLQQYYFCLERIDRYRNDLKCARINRSKASTNKNKYKVCKGRLESAKDIIEREKRFRSKEEQEKVNENFGLENALGVADTVTNNYRADTISSTPKTQYGVKGVNETIMMTKTILNKAREYV